MRIVPGLLMLAAFAVNAAVFEAETGVITPGAAKIQDHDGASGGKIVRLVGVPALKKDLVRLDRPNFVLPFTVDRDGAYGIVLVVCTENTGNDSVY